jgi:hypothetical protein
MVCDITNHPILWLTNVACNTPIQLIYDVVAWTLAPFLDAHEVVLLGSGILLDRSKKIDEVTWPIRSGKKGWRMDMWIVVRGFQYTCASLKAQVQADVAATDTSDDPSAVSLVSLSGVVLQENQQREFPIADPIDFSEIVEHRLLLAKEKSNSDVL